MEHRIAKLVFSLIASTIINTSCSEKNSGSDSLQVINPLLGSWEMASIHWVSSDTTMSINEAQPGILMVNPTRYSIMWTPIGEPRKAFEILAQPTEEEMKAGFRTIVFNAGTYEMTDSTFTTTAKIAKVPGFEGGRQFFRYSITNNVLILTMFDETYPDGTKPAWYGKYVTKLVLKKVE